jgi:malonate transporter
MTAAVLTRLLALFATVALGWAAGRAGLLGRQDQGAAATRALSAAAFYIFVPALLLRTMVRLDFDALPWRMLAAYFVPASLFVLLVHGVYRLRAARAALGAGGGAAAAAPAPPAAPATRAICACFGNGVQVGIPVVSALWGEPGLALLVALISLHGLVLLSMLTVLVEMDLARARRSTSTLATLRVTLRNAFWHPLTLPVLLGLAWNRTGLGLHPVLDQTLAGLGQAVVPLCLVLMGLTLAQYGLRGRWRPALAGAVLKLLVLPALVLLVAHGLFGLSGLPLAVVVVMAALPTGTNALIFAQRYDTLQAEATAAVVVSTLAFAATASIWLAVLHALS